MQDKLYDGEDSSCEAVYVTTAHIQTYLHQTLRRYGGTRPNVNVTYDVKGEDPLLRISLFTFEHIILPLLDNALRYTTEGTVQLTVEQCERNVQLIVQDTGCGIESHHLPFITDPFYRIHSNQAERGA